jgi:hypothetical protein
MALSLRAPPQVPRRSSGCTYVHQMVDKRRADTRVRSADGGAILCAMNTDSHRIPAKPTLDGLEDKWTQRWAKERVVQV